MPLTFISAPCSSSFLSRTRTTTRSASHRPASLSPDARPAFRMAADVAAPLTSPALDVSGKPSPVTNAMDAFTAFFACQTGSWNSERTYHYTDERPGREESATTFDVVSLSKDESRSVLASNGVFRDGEAAVLDAGAVESAAGFRVSFLTRMASHDELVRNATELAFVPLEVQGATVSGLYYRTIGYEESNLIIARFTFNAATNALSMVTQYTRVTSVDCITLVNPMMRLRNIVNYKRPAEGLPLTEPVLVGFGVEKKRAADTPKTVA